MIDHVQVDKDIRKNRRFLHGRLNASVAAGWGYPFEYLGKTVKAINEQGKITEKTVREYWRIVQFRSRRSQKATLAHFAISIGTFRRAVNYYRRIA